MRRRRVRSVGAVILAAVAAALAVSVLAWGSLASARRSDESTTVQQGMRSMLDNGGGGVRSVVGAAVDATGGAGGPFAVGISSVTYTDTSRPTDRRGEEPALPTRTIAVTLRYPVSGAAGDDETTAARARAGSYPLVVFAHGFDTSAATYATIEHQLAAAGFVVAAPDFPLTSSAFEGAPIEDDVSNQAADVSFVITSLLDSSSVPRELAGVIDADAIAVMGHSDGGVTAAAVAFNSEVGDPRVDAAVVLSGAEARYPGSWFTTQSPALLAIHGTADEVNPIASSTTLYDGASGPAMLVSVLGGSHLGPFTSGEAEPDVAQLAVDFLRAHLVDDAAASARLVADANVGGELALVASTDLGT